MWFGVSPRCTISSEILNCCFSTGRAGRSPTEVISTNRNQFLVFVQLCDSVVYLIMCEADVTIAVTEKKTFPLFRWRADPLLKVGRVSDVEHVMDVHRQRQANVVVVTSEGDAGDHGAY